uniref:RRM domain-containing protein n=1 Tax=Rhabditophanes sp. KR3021 TaxID=114890 RepID=A0AC35U017_9BILA
MTDRPQDPRRLGADRPTLDPRRRQPPPIKSEPPNVSIEDDTIKTTSTQIINAEAQEAIRIEREAIQIHRSNCSATNGMYESKTITIQPLNQEIETRMWEYYLKKVFASYGPIISFNITRPKSDLRNIVRKFTIQFGSRNDAARAIVECNGKSIKGGDRMRFYFTKDLNQKKMPPIAIVSEQFKEMLPSMVKTFLPFNAIPQPNALANFHTLFDHIHGEAPQEKAKLLEDFVRGWFESRQEFLPYEDLVRHSIVRVIIPECKKTLYRIHFLIRQALKVEVAPKQLAIDGKPTDTDSKFLRFREGHLERYILNRVQNFSAYGSVYGEVSEEELNEIYKIFIPGSDQNNYFRWKMFSILIGEGLDDWEEGRSVRIFEKGPIFIAPTRYFTKYALPKSLYKYSYFTTRNG